MPHEIVSFDGEATKGYVGKLVAKTVEETLDALLDEEADQLVNAGRHERADERTAYVANKARSMALYICIYVQLAAALAAILIFKQTLVGQVLCTLTCLQTLVYTSCFWYYNRKY